MKNYPKLWNEGKLEIEDIKEWVEANKEQINGKVDKDHVAYCLYKLYLDDKKGRSLGDFLQAVKENNFSKAVGKADKDNRKAIALYPMFIWNVAPVSYSDKILN